MKELAIDKEIQNWQLIGTSNCKGLLFLNDFPIGEFDSEKNTTIQVPLNIKYFVHGTQNIKIQLNSSCLGKLSAKNLIFDLRLAGFKTEDWPAVNIAEIKAANPFGKFPVMGLLATTFQANEFNAKGEIIKAAGTWGRATSFDDLSSVTLDEPTKVELGNYVKSLHQAFVNGDENFFKTNFLHSIESSAKIFFSDEESRKKLISQDSAQFSSWAKMPKLAGFNVDPLPVDGFKFKLVQEKVVQVLNKNGEVLRIICKVPKKGSLSQDVIVAKVNGHWVQF